MLRFVTTLIQRYRQCPELGWGDFEVLDQPHKAVLAHRCTWDDASLIALHNLSDKPVTVPVTVEGAGDGCKLDDLLRSDTTPLDAKGGAEFVLDGYGFRWLRLVEPDDQRLL